MNYNLNNECYFHYNSKTGYTHKYYKPIPIDVGKYTPNTSVWYKIDGTILYIRGTQTNGYSERVLYTDTNACKNGWYAQRVSITKAVIEEKIYPTSCARFFDNCTNMTTIENPENIVITKDCTSLFCMFQKCNSLTSVGDLSNWDTSKVTDMCAMFNNCNVLTSVGNFANITNPLMTTGMFQRCHKLTTIIGGFSNLTVSIDMHWSPLTYESAMTIINSLGTTTSATLTLKSATYNLLSNEDKSIAINKGWTIASI